MFRMVSGSMGKVGSNPNCLAVAFSFLPTESSCSQLEADSDAARQRDAVPCSLGRILTFLAAAGDTLLSYFPGASVILAIGAGVSLAENL